MQDVQANAVTLTADDKHPLANCWVIWYDSRRLHMRGNPNDWMANLVNVAVFNTVEDFWSTYNHIKRASELEFGSNYHMFKEGTKPMWEDDANKYGGKWVLTLNPKDDPSRQCELWDLLVLAMIGEYLDDGVEGDQICGAVLSRRKNGTRISVWTKDKGDANIELVGARIRTVLKLNDTASLAFSPHSESMDKLVKK
eukprot:NODE_1110_length_1097_cov_55.541031_g855_i0.p2 GENE.NODE_1110_length_1097_cov_55.541031_g855_i0~~NODE_1110_length_1097_cov_55.541031_g855_i0.p2  ORF type:complete len:222 (+),score=85.98 NODE_1110_length_1097_cov_55.541031_g855_i0:76-666(+)